MLKSKLHIVCNRFLVSSTIRHIRTDSILFKQFKKPRQIFDEEPSFIDPGIRHRASVFKDDAEFLQEVARGEANIEDLESDFRSAADSYDEHYAEMKRNKERLARIITKKKLFKPPKEPSMLTYNEKQQIKHLNAENPDEWDVKRLSESFPATEYIIKKILRANWRPASVEKIKEMDEVVAKNWELLAENKLTASPDLIEHCKKFVDRRETLLAQLKNNEFHKLPPIERKVKWQCGEMSKILLQYERQIDQLYQKQLEEKQKKELSGSTGSEIQKSIDANHMISQRIEYEKFLHDVEDKDTFIIGGESGSSEEVTLDFLENQIHQSAKNNEELCLFDKVILDKTSNKVISSDPLVPNKQLSSNEEKNDSTEQQKYSASDRPFPINEYVKKPKKKEEPRAKNQQAAKVIDESDFRKLKRSQKAQAETYNPFRKEEEKDFYDITDEELGSKAIRLEEDNISESLEFVNGENPKIKVKEKKDDIQNVTKKSGKNSKSKSISEGENTFKPKIELSYHSNEYLEKSRVENEISDIANTCFWNENTKKTKQRTSALNKAALAEPSSKKMTFEDDNYPDKIEIPQKYIGSGKVFKIKDCYYDDYGDFLYRVPGMTK